LHTHHTRSDAAGELTTARLALLQQSQVRYIRAEVTDPEPDDLELEAEIAAEAAAEAAELRLVTRRWKAIAIYCLVLDLSAWERRFLRSIIDRNADLTPKQARVLCRINDGRFGEVRP
jgi:hypothetical protein